MDQELTKYAMNVIRDFDRGSDAILEIDSHATNALTELLGATCHCDEMDDDTYDEVFGANDPIDAALTASGILARHNVVDSVPAIVGFTKFHIARNEFNDHLLDGIPDALAAFDSDGAAALLLQAITGDGHEAARCVLIQAVKESWKPPANHCVFIKRVDCTRSRGCRGQPHSGQH